MAQLYHLKALTAIMSSSFTFENKKRGVQGSETTYLRSYSCLIIPVIILVPFRLSLN